MDGAISDELSVISGVPQGSVLGPLLFLIYIDGVESVTLSDGTIVLYADDMVLYRPIYSYEDYWLLQQDINAIATWIADNHLQFNTSKCKYMTISQKRAKELPPTNNLNGIPLDREDNLCMCKQQILASCDYACLLYTSPSPRD